MLNHKISGFYIHDFLQVKRMNQFNSRYNELIERLGYLPRSFPSFGLISDLQKESSHIKIKPEVYYIGKNYFLKPTSEAIAYPLTYGDPSLKTPFKWYSVGPAFRNQSKYCRKNERHKEIAFFHESHSIFSSEKKALEEIEILLPVISNFLITQGIPHHIHIRPKEDTFPGAEKTYAFDAIFNGKVLQILTVHYLKDNFSKAYKKGTSFYGVCFGHSERIIGVLKDYYQKDLRWVKNPYSILSYQLLEKTTRERNQPINRCMYQLLREYNAVAIEKTPGLYFLPKTLDSMDGDFFTKDQVLEKINQEQTDVISLCKKKFSLCSLDQKIYGEKFSL